MTDDIIQPPTTEPVAAKDREAAPHPRQPHAAPKSSRLIFAGVGATLIALGAVSGVVGAGLLRPEPATFDATLATTPMTEIVTTSNGRVALSGKVAEIFGNKFVISDGTARVLVETGRAGEDGALVADGETILVQGQFDHGFLHAFAIRHASGEIEELAPPPRGPKHDHP